MTSKLIGMERHYFIHIPIIWFLKKKLDSIQILKDKAKNLQTPTYHQLQDSGIHARGKMLKDLLTKSSSNVGVVLMWVPGSPETSSMSIF